jgi:hypothetical protein
MYEIVIYASGIFKSCVPDISVADPNDLSRSGSYFPNFPDADLIPKNQLFTTGNHVC